MIYLDTSLLAPIFLAEPESASAERLVRGQEPGRLAISHLTRIEFTSLLARTVRMGRLDPASARRIDDAFESMVIDSFDVWAVEQNDFELAKTFLRRFETGLRAPDALHLAIAANRKATTIYTLDAGLRKAGRILGLPVRAGIRTA